MKTNDLRMYFSGFQDSNPAESIGSNITIDEESVCVVQQVQKLFEIGVKKLVVLNTTYVSAHTLIELNLI